MAIFLEIVKDNIDNCLSVINGRPKRGRFLVDGGLIKDELFKKGIYNPLSSRDLESAFLKLYSFESGVRRAELHLILEGRERGRKHFLAYGLELDGQNFALKCLLEMVSSLIKEEQTDNNRVGNWNF